MLIAAAGCLFLLSASCAKIEFHPTASEAFPLTPNASSFLPASPSSTPTVSATSEPTSTPTPIPTITAGEGTLRSYADHIGFGIGTRFLETEAKDPLFPPVFAAEFNTVTTRTPMRTIEPKREVWNWRPIDEVLTLATADHQKIIGGPLVYNNVNSPLWLNFDRPDCGGWTAEELDGIMQEYIKTVVTHFGNQVLNWKVINEPLTSADNCWHRILGDGYMERAFRYARAADPGAQLILNESFGWDGVDKRTTDDFFSLVRKIKADGESVDVAGIEMHLNSEILSSNYLEEFQYFLGQARKAGVKVMITEMDVYQGSPGFFPDPLDHQKEIFKNITQTCLSDDGCIDLIVWGISDAYTWLIRSTDPIYFNPRPLLFDKQFREKPAYFGVREALEAAAGIAAP